MRILILSKKELEIIRVWKWIHDNEVATSKEQDRLSRKLFKKRK